MRYKNLQQICWIWLLNFPGAGLGWQATFNQITENTLLVGKRD